MLFHVLLQALKESEDGGVNPGALNDYAFGKSEVTSKYAEIAFYEPKGWEAVGGSFLNSTKGSQTTSYDALLDDNGEFSFEKAQQEFFGVGLFLGITIFFACIFFLLAPIFCLCCSIKRRTTFEVEDGEKYKLTAKIILILSLCLLTSFSIIAAISSFNLQASSSDFFKGVGGVYVGGLNFTVDTKNTFVTILGNMAGFANDKINDFEDLSVNGTLKYTQGNLTILNSDLAELFRRVDGNISSLATNIRNLDDSLADIETTASGIETNYGQAATGLRATDDPIVFAGNSETHTYEPTTDAFGSIPNSFSADVSARPSLSAVASDVQSQEGKLGQEAANMTSGMSLQIDASRESLEAQYDNFRETINSGRSTFSQQLNDQSDTLLENAGEYETQFATYGQSFESANAGRNIGMLLFLLINIVIIACSLLCIRLKGRRIAMIIGSFLFLMACLCLVLSIIHFVMAFAVSEACAQLENGLPILAQVGADESVGTFIAAGQETIDLCAQGKSFDEILNSPVFEDILPDNFKENLNITLQYEKLMDRFNTSQFTDALDAFNVNELIDTDAIQGVTGGIGGIDFSIASFNIPAVDSSPVSSVITQASALNGTVIGNGGTYFTYTSPGSPLSGYISESEVHYLGRVNDQVVVLNGVVSTVSTLNTDIDNAEASGASIVSQSTDVKALMDDVTTQMTNSINSFGGIVDDGKSVLLDEVDLLPAEVLVLVVDNYNVARDEIKCTTLGQTLKVMEFQICQRFRDSLNGMWMSLWMLGFVLVLSFVGLHYAANILFRQPAEDDYESEFSGKAYKTEPDPVSYPIKTGHE